MYFVSMSDNGHLAFTGRHYVHIYSTRFVHTKSVRTHLESSSALTSLDLYTYMPSNYKGPLERISGVSCSISKNSNKLAVVDSEKNIYIFEKASHHPDFVGNRDTLLIGPTIRAPSWDNFKSFKMDVKILYATFNPTASNLFMLDRHGNVYISDATNAELISNPIQMIGHNAITQDLIYDSTGRSLLFTCNGKDTLQYSCYASEEKLKEDYQEMGGDDDEVSTFLFGELSSQITSMSLLNHDHFILTTQTDGTIKLWDFDNRKLVQSWNLFKVNHGIGHQKLAEHEVKRMKTIEIYGRIFLAAKISTYKEVPIFELDLRGKTLRKLGQVKMEFEYSDFVWADNVLYVYNPDSTSLIKRFSVSAQGIRGDAHFHIPSIGRHHTDFESFVEFYKGSASLNKYFSSDFRIKQIHRNKLMDQSAVYVYKKDKDIAPTYIRSRSVANGTLEKPNVILREDDSSSDVNTLWQVLDGTSTGFIGGTSPSDSRTSTKIVKSNSELAFKTTGNQIDLTQQLPGPSKR